MAVTKVFAMLIMQRYLYRKVTFIHIHPADLTFSSLLSFCSIPVFQELSLTMSSISNTPISSLQADAFDIAAAF